MWSEEEKQWQDENKTEASPNEIVEEKWRTLKDFWIEMDVELINTMLIQQQWNYETMSILSVYHIDHSRDHSVVGNPTIFSA